MHSITQHSENTLTPLHTHMGGSAVSTGRTHCTDQVFNNIAEFTIELLLVNSVQQTGSLEGEA